MKRHPGNMLGIAALAALVVQAGPALADPPAHSQGWRNGQGHSENVRRDDHKQSRRDVREGDRAQPGWRADGRNDGRRDYRRDDDWRRDDRDHDWRDRNRDDNWRDHDRHRYDDRYRHHYRGRYYYPRYGYTVTNLPHRHRIVHHHGSRYFYGDGFWYRPFGAGFMIVAPPIGLVVPFLPDAYTTLFFGGVPYYRAHDVYYVWRPQLRGYVVTNPPW